MFELINSEKEIFAINWYYTDKCNQNCEYCPLVFKNKKSNNNLLKHILLKEFRKKDYQYIFEIEGGEPTLDQSVFDLPDFFEDIDSEFILYTNFLNSSNNIPQYKKYLQKHRVIISINLSIYSSKFSKELSEPIILDYLKNIILLKEYLNNIEVNILVDTVSEKTWNVYKNLAKFFNSNNINYFANFAEDFYKVNDLVLNMEDVKYYDNFSNEINYCRLKYNFYNYRCKRKFIKINCFDLNVVDCSSNYIKSIYSFKIEDFNKDIICKNKICGIDNFQLNFKKERAIHDN